MTRTLRLASGEEFTLTEMGEGHPALVLHGGGGPGTVQNLSAHLAGTMRAVTPIHPGWEGTSHPEGTGCVADLAQRYLALLQELDMKGVVVIGSSLGGWIAIEMALQDKDNQIGSLVLIDAVGILVADAPITRIFELSPRQMAEHIFFDADRFFVDPSSLPPERQALQRDNGAAMMAIAGDPYMHDPNLLDRLGDVGVPALVLWGEADRVVTPAYGKAFAAALPKSEFTVIPQAGHLPHLEQPEPVFARIDDFDEAQRTPGAVLV